ncbi:hypothetical protein BsWGS_15724 [Bradybaena similaris]
MSWMNSINNITPHHECQFKGPLAPAAMVGPIINFQLGPLRISSHVFQCLTAQVYLTYSWWTLFFPVIKRNVRVMTLNGRLDVTADEVQENSIFQPDGTGMSPLSHLRGVEVGGNGPACVLNNHSITQPTLK